MRVNNQGLNSDQQHVNGILLPTLTISTRRCKSVANVSLHRVGSSWPVSSDNSAFENNSRSQNLSGMPQWQRLNEIQTISTCFLFTRAEADGILSDNGNLTPICPSVFICWTHQLKACRWPTGHLLCNMATQQTM